MFESCGVQAEEGISEAHLSNADFAVLKGRKPEEARSLTNTDLRGVKGLTQEQLEACKARSSGASSSQPGPEL